MKWSCDVVKLWMFVLLGVFLVGFVGAADSSSEAMFNIEGCGDFWFDGDYVAVAGGECSSEGESAGYFFCGSNLVHFITTNEGLGCSMGSDDYEPGDESCCPDDTFCNEISAGSFKCERRTVNCVNQDSPEECESASCVWMEIAGECVDNPRDFDCGYYNTNESCAEDVWDIGVSGIGTELCGSTIECDGRAFSVSGCGCQWYPLAPAEDRCRLVIGAGESVYGIGGSENRDRFECSSNYTLGECVDGDQEVRWDSDGNVVGGDLGSVPDDCMIALGCEGGEDVRSCGETLIKLPGFSFFSLIVSIFVIGIYYFVLGKFKCERGCAL